jgi:hypothetical protein
MELKATHLRTRFYRNFLCSCINKSLINFSKYFRFCCLFLGVSAPQWARASLFTRFLDHTQRRTTVGKIPLDNWSARRRDLYLTTHNTHNRQTSMLPAGFEPKISAGEGPQTYALDRAATGTGKYFRYTLYSWLVNSFTFQHTSVNFAHLMWKEIHICILLNLYVCVNFGTIKQDPCFL